MFMNAHQMSLQAENFGLFMLFLKWRILLLSCSKSAKMLFPVTVQIRAMILAGSKEVGHTGSLDQRCTFGVYMSTLKPLTHRNSYKHVHTHTKTHKQTLSSFLSQSFVCFLFFAQNFFLRAFWCFNF